MLAYPAKLWLINTDLDAADGYGTKMSPRNHIVALAESQHHVIDPTNPRGALDDGVEHRLHVRRRAADDAEHLGRCRLMLQGLAQFGIALAEFLEQADVLDGDHGLSGEGFEQRDLLLGKRLHLRTANYDHTDRTSLRVAVVSASIVRHPVLVGDCYPEIVCSSAVKIMNVDRFAIDERSPVTEPTDQSAMFVPPRQRNRSVVGDQSQHVHLQRSRIVASFAPHTRAAFSATYPAPAEYPSASWR